MSLRYAGIVANPPPYMDRMMQNAATNSGIEPIWPKWAPGRRAGFPVERTPYRYCAGQCNRRYWPRKSTHHVEQTDESNEARGRRRRHSAREHFLIMGDACPNTPMPRSRSCTALPTAARTAAFARHIDCHVGCRHELFLMRFGDPTCGFQPSAGTRTVIRRSS